MPVLGTPRFICKPNSTSDYVDEVLVNSITERGLCLIAPVQLYYRQELKTTTLNYEITSMEACSACVEKIGCRLKWLQKTLAIDSFELLTFALLARCSYWLSCTALHFTLFWVLSLYSFKLMYRLQKMLARERLELWILALLRRCSNRLSYTALHFTLFFRFGLFSNILI